MCAHWTDRYYSIGWILLLLHWQAYPYPDSMS